MPLQPSLLRSASKFFKFLAVSTGIAALIWLGWLGVGFFLVGSASQSHINANIPKEVDFDTAFRSALERRFCGLSKECRIEYELLRKGSTQSGTSYPKYYAWMRCFSENGLKMEGAVRLAAEDEVFIVREFISKSEIIESPEVLRSVFPAALVGDIQRRAISK